MLEKLERSQRYAGRPNTLQLRTTPVSAILAEANLPLIKTGNLAQYDHQRRCHLTFIWCPSHSGIRGDELADVAAKEGTTVEREGDYHDSAGVVIQLVTKEPPIANERLWRES